MNNALFCQGIPSTPCYELSLDVQMRPVVVFETEKLATVFKVLPLLLTLACVVSET